ncbi:homeobox protein PKNOX2 [Anabrus simplex]|uniref:homeobox protein PKNOX2 n=1 Tax=Anabrus simplex TaxID=316456 RepID=UPI0035A3C39B
MQEGSTMVTPGYEQTEAGGGVAMTTGASDQGSGFSQPDQAQFEADKRSVYKHPLFPLLALLFERCEQATQSAECPNSESFNMDIQAFVQHQERDRKPFLVNDPEVDGLMIKAIQVLRIHLLELEKVQELCKDFCNRYITCLKGKMQSENLLRSDYASYENNNNSSSNSHSSNSNSPAGNTNYPTSPHTLQVVSSAGGVPNQHQQLGAGGGALLMHHQPPGPQHSNSVAAAVNNQIAYHMLQTPQGLVAAPVHLPAQQQPPVSPGVVHGGTPLSQIGANPCPPPSESSLLQGQLSPAPTTPGSVDDDDDFLSNKKKQKRGVLPKHATSVMRSWLFQHLVHPYPTEDEKRQIAAQTNLTLLQVNNWFINARRRILQPMLDASNPASGDGQPGTGNNMHKSSSSKKAKSSGNGNSKQAAQRFWPENIASLQPQLGLNESNGASHTDSSLISSTVLSSDESEVSSQDEDEEDDFDDEDRGDGIHPKRECSSDSERSQQQ